MPNAGIEIFEKLAAERARMGFEAPSIVLWAEDRGMGAAVLLQPKQTAMLWVAGEKQSVFDRQYLRGGWQGDRKAHDLVGTVAVVIDQVFGRRHRAAGAVSGDRQPSERV